MRPAALAIGTLLAALALLAPGARAFASEGDPRTLVVRGRVLSSAGVPVAGARVSARGSGAVDATTDDRGRYTLTLPIGSAAGLRRSPFRLEVRVMHQGRRLPLGGGASALSIEAAPVPGTPRIRVRSNLRGATTAVTSAFLQEGPATAWVEADFGGAPMAGAVPAPDAVDEVDPGGLAPERGPGVSAPKGAGDSAATPRTVAGRAGADRARETSRSSGRRMRRTASGRLVPVRTPPRAVGGNAAPPRATVAIPAGADSAPAPPLTAATTPARADSAPASPAAAAVQGTAPADRPRVRPADPLVPRGPLPPPESAGPDTCACRLRGTVEIDWERPLERDFPIEVLAEGPVRRSTTVDMFIGSPREFGFGPLPCGDYRLSVRPGGRVRYTFARGDTVLAVSCRGPAQERLVLVPAKRP